MKKYFEIYLFGSLCTLLGIIVISGWYLHIPLLIQVLPNFAPMQYNTALGFLLSGVAILCLLKAKKVSTIISILLFLNGFLVLIQYIFHLNLGIDQLFMEHYIKTYTSHPGRMAPNTALCFTLTGIAFFLHNNFKNRTYANVTSSIFISIVGIFGFLSVLGYLISLKVIYGWGNLTGMAVHTAVGFILIAVATFRFVTSPYLKQPFKTGFMLPILVASLGFIFFFISWQSLLTYQDKNLKKSIARDNSFAKNSTILALQGNIYAIERLFYRIGRLSQSNLTILREDINNYFKNTPSLLLVSFQPNTSKKLKFLSNNVSEQEAEKLLKTCKLQLKLSPTYLSGTTVATNGNLLCLSENNLHKLAIFSVDSILNYIFRKPQLAEYGVSLSSQHQTYYLKEIKVSDFFKKQWGATENFSLLGKKWLLSLWISEKGLQNRDEDLLPLVYFFFGLIITLCLSLMIRVWQNSLLKNLQLNKANKKVQRYSEQLKRSNEELDEFAYIASHDLKEPLRGINNFSKFLTEDHYDKLDDEGKKQLETIQKLCQRMEILINDLLTFSRVNRLDLSFGQCDINDAIKDKIEFLKYFLEKNHAEIIMKKTMPTITCDKARIGEVFQNFITNAVKYNESDVKTIEIDWSENQKEYIFSMKDNGIGISKKDQEKVFKMFKRLHARDEYGGGTGAGMSITQKIIKRHGGKVWFESEPGKGTTFYFTIKKKFKFNNKKDET